MSDTYLLPFQRELLDEVDLALEEVAAGATSKGILLIGESGAGKTKALDILNDHVQLLPYAASDISPYQQLTAVCRLTSRSKAGAISIAKGILAKLGKPIQTGARIPLDELESDAIAALKARKVRLLVFEEFHNTLLAGSRQLRGQSARLLKNIWNMEPEHSSANWVRPDASEGERLVIVVSGTAELLPVFEKEAELSSRFFTLVTAPRIKLYPPEDFQQFRQVARSMCRDYGLDEALLDVAKDHAMAARLYFATDGHLRRLDSLLLRFRTLRNRGQNLSAIETLGRALSKGLSNPVGIERNPFLWTEEELKSRVNDRINALKRQVAT